MERPTCKTCVHWDYNKCFRHAPAPTFEQRMHQGVYWPETVIYEYCGEHQDFPEYLEWYKKTREALATT